MEQYDQDYVFELIRAAYERGYHWGQENPDSHSFLNKAAYDYADKTLGQTYAKEENDQEKGEE